MYIRSFQLSLHVEEDLDQKEAPAHAPYWPTSSASQELDLSQRDLDDPNIEEGVGTSDIPLRQRKLFAQPLTTGGPTSDASSEESTDESSA